MSILTSQPFTSSSSSVREELENCARGLPSEVVSHFAPGSTGKSREAIQLLQRSLSTIALNHPELKLSPFQISGVYDEAFAKAVSEYKAQHGLLNYQQRIDPIIGRKTIVAIDNDLNSFPGPVPAPPSPPPPPSPNIDPHVVDEWKGMRRLTNGMWNRSASLSIQGGQAMTFKLINRNILGATVQISNENDRQSVTLLPMTSGEIEFTNFVLEPHFWTFSIESEADAFFILWELWSSWIPGDPPNR